MKIYIDFDRTIYDTDEFIKDLKTKCLEYGISEDLFNEKVKELYLVHFNCFKLLDTIYEHTLFDKKLYEDFQTILDNGDKYVFTDSILALKTLKQKDYNITILTFGDKEFQLNKINHSGVLPYVDNIIVTGTRKDTLELNYENCVFIDDNPKELLGLYNKKSSKIIRIKRDNCKYSDISMDLEISTYRDLMECVNDL